jgi:6-phosphogluconolactonase
MAESIKKPVIRSFPNLGLMSQEVAKKIVRIAGDSIDRTGRFSLALAGGNTPTTLYQLLGGEHCDKIDWSSTHLFWGDERFISSESEESNFNKAYRALISRIPIPEQNVHPIQTDDIVPDMASKIYEKELKDFFQLKNSIKNYTTFNLVILGLGVDGHTASLFPGDPVLYEREGLVKNVKAPRKYLTRNRITLTLPTINSAERVYFLVSGPEKKEILRKVLNESGSANTPLPAELVRPNGELLWFVTDNKVEP